MHKQMEGYHQQRKPVPDEFEQIISYFYSAINGTDGAITRILVPSFQTIMVFSFGPPIRFGSGNGLIELDQCLVLGPVKRPVEYTLPPAADMLVVNFRDDAFYRFFGPALASGMVAAHPDQLLQQNCFHQLWFSLKNEPAEKRAGILLEFCKPYLQCRDALFEGISNESADYLSVSPIKAVAQKTGQSERNIQLSHKKFLGYSAKERARYERFLKALNWIQNNPGKVDWLQIVEACGYYDQSQLIHDFKHYLSLSPGRYVKFQAEVCRVGA